MVFKKSKFYEGNKLKEENGFPKKCLKNSF